MLPPSTEAPVGTPLELVRRRGSASQRTSSSGGARVKQPAKTLGAAGTPHGTRRSRSSLSSDHCTVSRTGRSQTRRRHKRTKERGKQGDLLVVPRVVRSDASRDTARTRTTPGRQEFAELVGNGMHTSRRSTGKLRRGKGGSSRSSSRDGDDRALTGRVGGAASFQSEIEKIGVVTDLVELFQQVPCFTQDLSLLLRYPPNARNYLR